MAMKARGRSPVLASSAGGAMTPQSSHSLPASARTSRISAANGAGSNASSGGRGSFSGRSGSAQNDDHSAHHSTGNSLSARVPSETSSVSAEYNDASPAHGRLNPNAEAAAGHLSTSDQSGLGNSVFYDEGHEMDGLSFSATPDPAMTQRAIDQVQAKIEKTKELIREEQTSRDDNVNEYLKLSSNADRLQQGRIKQLFEKKNQKSAQSIQHLQKKLDDYQRKLLDLQEHGIRPKQSHKLGQGLKNVRDGLTGMTGSVMSKPKEFAHLLRHKFGSADNLSSISKDSDSDPQSGTATGAQQNQSGAAGGSSAKKTPNRNHHGSASLPRENSGGGFSGSGGHPASQDGSHKGKRSSLGAAARRKCISDDGRRSENSESVATSNSEDQQMRPHGASHHHTMHEIAESNSSPQKISSASAHAQVAETFSEWKAAMMTELNLHKEEVDHLREEIDEQRQNFKHEIEALSEQLREERDRSERLEEQMNDMTELHQHEIENIKSGVNDMEEKVQYQSEERLLDIKEHLQSLETKVTSLEHQQTQQQYLNIEGLDTGDARAIMMKLLTAVITVIHVILFFVGTAMSLAKPFFRTTGRSVVSLVVVIFGCVVYHQRETLHLLTLKFIGPKDSVSEPAGG